MNKYPNLEKRHPKKPGEMLVVKPQKDVDWDGYSYGEYQFIYPDDPEVDYNCEYLQPVVITDLPKIVQLSVEKNGEFEFYGLYGDGNAWYFSVLTIHPEIREMKPDIPSNQKLKVIIEALSKSGCIQEKGRKDSSVTLIFNRQHQMVASIMMDATYQRHSIACSSSISFQPHAQH